MTQSMQQPPQQPAPRPYGISNDQTATKAGRARVRLQEFIPRGAHLFALEATSHSSTSGNSVYEFYIFATHPEHGHIILLNRYLRPLGFGVNRRRGTIRTTDELYRTIDLIATRVHGDPDALTFSALDTTV